MNADTAIRLLGPDDLAPMRALLAMFSDAFEDPDHYAAHPPGDAWLRALLARDTFFALAAWHGGEVVGGLAGYLLPKFEQEHTECYIYDLAVDAAHRRQGVATALIGALQQLAAERGWSVIFVQADLGDDPAIALYTKLGTRADVLHFDIVPAARPAP